MKLRRHVLLCGFMACGKTTVGRLAARRLGVPFADTDMLIEEKTGQTIPEIFEARGEASFRDLEHEVLCSLPSLSPRVIATGGGLPTFARNAAPLRAAGLVLFLDRDFDDIWLVLSRRTGRPLAKDRTKEEMRALYEARLPLYRSCADDIIKSCSRVEDTVDLILSRVSADCGTRP
ncbi:MAG: shikimate kinase [Clostridia bacterium]|nr:shikimate kinase [Clostridia bacterium]